MKDYYWLNKNSREFLNRDYLLEGVTPEQRIRQIADRAEEILGIEGFADKFEGYMKKGYFSLSTPIWINFGLERGLPISCYGSYFPDDMGEIMKTNSEVAMMTKHGGGTSGYFGDIRGRGTPIAYNGTSNGSVSMMEITNTIINITSQGRARRGSFAASLPVDHPDLKEFLKIRSEGHPIQDLSIGVTVPEGWMQSMIDGDPEKRDIWVKILKKRAETGYPYVFFTDNVNNNKPQVYKDKDMKIHHSNLCQEICLPNSEEISFVCDLSSLNLLHFNEWRQTDAVETLTYFLDAVMTEFIEKASKIQFLEKAVKFAREHRAIGIGVLGWHSFLQSNMIPFEGLEAKMWNAKIFQFINMASLAASKQLAVLFGEPKVLEGYGERFTTRTAIAPTTSSAFILGQVSPSIEPEKANIYIKDLAKGKFTYKNPYLKAILKELGMDNAETWKSIMLKGGSVQHLDFLPDEVKAVFKTFGEISQMEIVQLAAQRQKFIDQAQSLNLAVHPDTPVKEINALMIEAWKLGVKTLYYQRGVNAAQEVGRSLMTCVSCES